MKLPFLRLSPDLIRRRLSGLDAMPQLAVLGLLTGVITGLVILTFRTAIEWPLELLLPGGNDENFEALPWQLRLVIPILGAVIIGVALHRMDIQSRKFGVVYVMERLKYHQGHLPTRSIWRQFFAGIATIGSGQSAGREGPAVHLGAASASLIGRKLGLPNNSMRVMVACGTAAAIAASFNTPIAGVVFAMEVVMMEYTITGFTPVILAAVTGAMMQQPVYGSEPAFAVPALNLHSLFEVPFIVITGVVIGAASAMFVRLLLWTKRFSDIAVWARICAAGILTGLVAVLVPEVMGIGYDTVNLTFAGEVALGWLIVIALAKLLVSSVAIGLGMPSGIIGPMLVIGATLGAAMGAIGMAVLPGYASDGGFYAMLGMAAMMGSLLQAPLTALLTLLELTHNPHIILPGMLIVVVASMTAREVFGQRSIFISILKSQGLNYLSSPLDLALRRVSVAATMQREFVRAPRRLSVEVAKALLKDQPQWILIDGEGKPLGCMPAADLARHLSELPADSGANDADASLDLLAIPAHRRDVARLHYEATLQEALERLEKTSAGALYVERMTAPMIYRVFGILTPEDIQRYYRVGQD